MNFDHSHKRARDAGEQAASLPDWDQRYEQLSAGRFEGEVDELRVGPVQVFAERANQTVMQAGRVCANRVSVALVRAGQSPGWFGGHRLQGEQLIGVSSQGEFDLVASADMQILALSVDLAALRELVAQVDGSEAELPPVPLLLKPTSAARTEYGLLLNAALRLAQNPSELSAHPASRRMLALSLCDALLANLRSGDPTGALPASAASRRRIVARARQYMQAHAHEVIAVPDLCQAIGSSRRALQYAFEEVMQISPVTYLRAMRLNQVRSELRQNRAAPVGDVAARWGFWHPSRFASDYKALFGELPSATRSAAAAREPLTA
ncbi:helix-turn-helix domain-containing protein [Hydrogenophaga sp. D2P1]|uniref:Helix-turn-helix domain-containing protein n=2 Tax=Hydrogenophaga aromaticivorans TaxID=2610898 RepID=A0A7Y8KXL1_9BURK|nr:helix-turn-helix domain-containing protein [Hydrogenophaga aromaticivorans]NWF46740.1 helix-turn-helix domain-containing protein [Hydrogenophaga aromaticivorans]